jgi:hypothetical protein
MIDNDSHSHDPFLLRYGAVPGRCNSVCKSGKPCRRYPVKGHARCHRHGGGWTRPGRSKEHIRTLAARRWNKIPTYESFA